MSGPSQDMVSRRGTGGQERSRRLTFGRGGDENETMHTNRPLFRSCLVAVLLSLTLSGCRPRSSTSSAALDRLLNLMRERLVLMHEVARWKWTEKRPIADPARERDLLDRLAARARDRGLSEALV